VRTPSERTVIFLIGAVQFINILEFMMVMPLGPDFALALGIATSELGKVGGSYTAAAFVSGVLGSFILERYDRRNALLVAMLGLGLGTIAGGFAVGLKSLMAARLVAGFFGGPATSLALSIVADRVPAERRGKALGAVMGAFSLASVMGVPVGLELARWGGWRLPFFLVGVAGLFIGLSAVWLLPPMREHLASLAASKQPTTLWTLLATPAIRRSWTMTAGVMMAGFVLIPNFSAFFQFNLGYPREHLHYLYMAGGVVSFGVSRIGGRWVDRFGASKTVAAASVLLVAVVCAFFLAVPPLLPVLAGFVLFMFGMALRNISHSTLTSLVPRPFERARFMSFQSAVQHLASACAAFLSAALLSELPDRSLSGMPRVAAVNLILTAALPWLFWRVETAVKARATLVPPSPGVG